MKNRGVRVRQLPRTGSGQLSVWRQNAGYSSARQAANKIKISAVYMYEIERGTSRPSLEVLQRLADLYNKTPGSVWRAWVAIRIAALKAEIKLLESA